MQMAELENTSSGRNGMAGGLSTSSRSEASLWYVFYGRRGQKDMTFQNSNDVGGRDVPTRTTIQECPPVGELGVNPHTNRGRDSNLLLDPL